MVDNMKVQIEKKIKIELDENDIISLIEILYFYTIYTAYKTDKYEFAKQLKQELER